MDKGKSTGRRGMPTCPEILKILRIYFINAY
jgi:hypothetical protein